jgi:hypothetical protein
MQTVSIPKQNPDMPPEVAEQFLEAKDIFGRSPKSAAVLLRMAVKNLCIVFGCHSNSIDADVHGLIAQGLPESFWDLLVAVKICGPNVVKSGEICITDDKTVAMSLFYIVNFIVDQLVSRPKRLAEIHGILEGKVMIADATEVAATSLRYSNPFPSISAGVPSRRPVEDTSQRLPGRDISEGIITNPSVQSSFTPVSQGLNMKFTDNLAKRCQKFVHEKKEIFLADFSYVNYAKENLGQVIQNVQERISKENFFSVLVLTDIHGLLFDDEIVNLFIEYITFIKPYTKASAVIGAEELKKTGYHQLLNSSIQDLQLFDTREEGLYYLIADTFF